MLTECKCAAPQALRSSGPRGDGPYLRPHSTSAVTGWEGMLNRVGVKVGAVSLSRDPRNRAGTRVGWEGHMRQIWD